MPQILDPTTWALWVFMPIMRYIFFPTIMGKTLHAYILLIPLFLIGVMAVYFGFASNRAMETLIAGAVLVVMLYIDLWRAIHQINILLKKIRRIQDNERKRDALLV